MNLLFDFHCFLKFWVHVPLTKFSKACARVRLKEPTNYALRGSMNYFRRLCLSSIVNSGLNSCKVSLRDKSALVPFSHYLFGRLFKLKNKVLLVWRESFVQTHGRIDKLIFVKRLPKLLQLMHQRSKCIFEGSTKTIYVHLADRYFSVEVRIKLFEDFWELGFSCLENNSIRLVVCLGDKFSLLLELLVLLLFSFNASLGILMILLV